MGELADQSVNSNQPLLCDIITLTAALLSLTKNVTETMFFQSLNLLEEVKGFYFFSQSTNPHKQLQGNFIH